MTYWVEVHCDRKRADNCTDDSDAPGAGGPSASSAVHRVEAEAKDAGWVRRRVADPLYGAPRLGWVCPACQTP